MDEWLNARLAGQRAAITRIEIFCFDTNDFPLRSLPNLKSVNVQCICTGVHANDPEEGAKIVDKLQRIWGMSALDIQITDH